MTTAPQLAAGTTTQNIDDTSYSIFQNLNAPNGQQLVCGNIFLGLQGACAVVIPLGELAGLARGGQIEAGLVNAAVTFRAAAAWTAGGTINVNCMIDDSPRGGPLDDRLAWKPPGGHAGWRRDLWGSFDTRLEDTGGTPFLDNGPSTVGSWGIRTLAGARDQLAQVFTVPAGPGWSVARMLAELRRFGNPPGSMEIAIQGDTTFPSYGGGTQPDGVDIAVSAPVACSSVAVSPGTTVATFSFSPDVVLAPGTYWAVMRSTLPYPVSVTDFIVWMQRRAFFNSGGAHLSTGDATNAARFARGLYPGHVDVSQDMAAKPAGAAIIWNPPARSTGQSVSTPDLSPLVQEVILSSGHETASALCFVFTTSGETRTFRFAANAHATLDPPGFAAQYRRRDVVASIL